MKPQLLVQGMHGMGDNIHQRAVMRLLMEKYEVFLETSWVSIYHDLPELKVIAKSTTLRTQTKNADREAALFSTERPRSDALVKRIWYRPEDVRKERGVLAAMCKNSGVNLQRANFRLSIPDSWLAEADRIIAELKPSKPILFYRPLVDRTEWGGCPSRNPDFAAYASLVSAIRDKFFLISVADLVPQKEWIVGVHIEPDAKFHFGELPFETLAALISRSAMTFCSPGFAVPLSQAVGTPVACVFGGYEQSYSFAFGGKFAPYLGIDTINPCDCFSHNHACEKRIDVYAAKHRLQTFASAAASQSGYSRSSDRLERFESKIPASGRA